MRRNIAISIRCVAPHLAHASELSTVLRYLEVCAKHECGLSVLPLRGLTGEILRSISGTVSVLEVLGPWRIDLRNKATAHLRGRLGSLLRRYQLLGDTVRAQERAAMLLDLWPAAVGVGIRASDPVEPLVYDTTGAGLIEIITESYRPLVVDLHHWNRLIGEAWTTQYCELLQPHNVASIHVHTQDVRDWRLFLEEGTSVLGTQLHALRHVELETPVVVQVNAALFRRVMNDLTQLRERIEGAMSE